MRNQTYINTNRAIDVRVIVVHNRMYQIMKPNMYLKCNSIILYDPSHSDRSHGSLHFFMYKLT